MPPTREDPPAGSSPGPGVDRFGMPVYDPSNNVYALVESAMRRQDDLRVMSNEHTMEMASLRAEHARELRQIESARLDAIRLVDVGAVQRAAEVQATQASALAAQVVATADAFRVSLAAALEPIQKDIRDLRDAQSRGVGGKEQVADTSSSGRDRLQLLSVVIAAIVLAVGIYAAFHQ